MAQYSVNWSAKLHSTSGSVAIGTCLVRSDADLHFVGTTANRTTYGRCVGVAYTAGDSSNPTVIMIETGIIPQEITGLAAGTVSWVRVSSTGTMERVTPGSGDDIIGKAHADGSVQFTPGVWDSTNYAGGGGGGSTPTGTGLPHIVSGVQDAAASLVVNADVDAAAAIAVSKLAAGTAYHVVRTNAAGAAVESGAVDLATAAVTGVLPTGNIATTLTGKTLTTATINGSSNTITNVSLTTAVTGTLPVANGGTGITSLGAGVATWMGTPSSANLLAALTTKTGTGTAVFSDTPTLVTPVIGAATGTSLVLSGLSTVGGVASHGNQIIGLESASSPYGVHGLVEHVFASDADYTAAASVYKYDSIVLNAGSWTTGHTISWPRPATADGSYEKTIRNDTGFNAANRTVTGGVTRTLPDNVACRMQFSDFDGCVFAGVPYDWLTGIVPNAFIPTTLDGKTLTNAGLTSPAISSPTITGSPIVTATDISATGNARGRIYSNIASVQTTDATVTSLYTWTILDEAVSLVTYEGGADLSTGADTAAYVRRIKFKRDGGTVTAGTVEATFTDESDATWDCTIDNSTSTGRVRVTGKAASTIDHAGVVTRLEVTHA